MAEQKSSAAATPNPAEEQKPNVLNDASADPNKSVMSEAAAEQQQAQEAENKRLLDADPNTLSEEDKPKREALVKTNEEKRLSETPKEQLSAEDQVKKEALEKAKAEEAKAKEVPEKYEIKVPEGMTLDQGLVDKLTPVFKEFKLTQAGAQKVADVYAQHLKEQADKAKQDFDKFTQDSYDETTKAVNKEQLACVARVRDRFFSQETRDLLDGSGLANCKTFILDLAAIGKVISEDKHVAGVPQTGEKSAAETLYPEQGK